MWPHILALTSFFLCSFKYCLKNEQECIIRVVTKISSCRVNTTIRPGIKQLGISFGSIFPLFSKKVAANHTRSSRGKSPPLGSYDSPGIIRRFYTWLYTTASFLNGLKISDLDLFILSLIFRFEVIYVQTIGHKVKLCLYQNHSHLKTLMSFGFLWIINEFLKYL